METRTSILAADRPEGIQTLRNVLGDAVELIAATTLDKAIHTLHETRIRMIICGIHFDDSRMFDLLGAAKQSVKTSGIPFLIFRDLDNALDRTFSKSIEIASKSLGAVAFVDLFALKQHVGIPAADRQFREIIQKYLP